MYLGKHISTLLLALVATSSILCSCSSSDDDAAELSDNCYISSFTLGTLRRTIYGLTSAGMDSIYTTAFSGSYFPMIIDQRKQRIENLDSLPIRTLTDRVLVSVAFEGTLLWRKADISTLEDTTWTAYNKNDSIDLTDSLHFRVYAENTKSSRTYTVKVNIHQQQSDSTTWDSLGIVTALEPTTERKATVWNNKLTILATQADGTLLCVQHPLGTSGEWAGQNTVGTANAIPSTLQQQGNRLLLSTSDGQVLESTDAITWSAASFPTLAGLRLVAASDDYVYALAAGRLYRSNGATWDEEPLDDDASLLPTDQLNSVFYTLKNGMPRLILVGRKAVADTHATIWAKSWEKGTEAEEGWMYYTPNNADKYRCPALRNLCIVPYDNGLQALGGRSEDGTHQALDVIRHSSDHGITWKTYDNNDMNVDHALQKAAQAAQYITATADDNHFLWIVAGNQVWRGRINRLGFLRN